MSSLEIQQLKELQKEIVQLCESVDFDRPIKMIMNELFKKISSYCEVCGEVHVQPNVIPPFFNFFAIRFASDVIHDLEEEIVKHVQSLREATLSKECERLKELCSTVLDQSKVAMVVRG